MKYFDPQNIGFFDDRHDEINGRWIPESDWGISFDELMNGNASGKEIKADQSGRPVLQEVVITYEKACENAKQQRDAAIDSSMWVVQRHNSQKQLNIETSITDMQFTELLKYHQALRDWPAQPGWPDIEMPPAPDWLAEMKK